MNALWLVEQPELDHGAQAKQSAVNDELLGVAQALFEQRFDDAHALPADAGENGRQSVEEGGAHPPVALLVEYGDHMGQEEVGGARAAEERAQLADVRAN